MPGWAFVTQNFSHAVHQVKCAKFSFLENVAVYLVALNSLLSEETL